MVEQKKSNKNKMERFYLKMKEANDRLKKQMPSFVKDEKQIRGKRKFKLATTTAKKR